MPHSTAPRPDGGLRRASPIRWLSRLLRRRLARGPLLGRVARRRERHGQDRGRALPALSPRSARWLNLMTAVTVMAALFAVLLSAA